MGVRSLIAKLASVLLIVGGTTVIGVLAVGSGPAAAQVGAPFACSQATDFLVADGQLYQAVEASSSPSSTAPHFVALGSPYSDTYNALGFDPITSYLYAVGTSGDLLQIDSTGAVRDLGSITGLPSGTNIASGGFDPAGNLWVVAQGGNFAYEIDVATVAVTSSVELTTHLNSSGSADDITYDNGDFWAFGDSVLYDVAPSGHVTQHDFGPDSDGQADWTYSNGDLGIVDANTGTWFSVTGISGSPSELASAVHAQDPLPTRRGPGSRRCELRAANSDPDDQLHPANVRECRGLGDADGDGRRLGQPGRL